MKKILLTLAAAFIALTSLNAQLTQVVVESANDGSITDCPGAVQPAGTTTYRIYAELNDATDFLSAVYAIDGCYPLNISTTTDFYNTPEFLLGPNPFNGGGKFGNQVNTGFCFFEPGIGLDSWVAIGGPNSGSGAQDVWTNPADPLAGLGDPANSGSISAQDGSWFVLNGDPGGVPTGPNNRVLLGQFTTDGEFSFTININIFDDGDNSGGNLQYVASSDLTCSILSGTMFDGSQLGLIFPAPAADVEGCTDINACNYDATATLDDGSCELYDIATPSMVGDLTFCNDGVADNLSLNYTATGVNDSFISALVTDDSDNVIAGANGTVTDIENVDWDGFFDGDDYRVYLLAGADGMLNDYVSGISNISEIDPCYDVELYFNITANDDGCTNPLATNFDANACADDGSCILEGCTDAGACNFDATANTDDGSCDFLTCAGCTDSTACNFDATATIDDGSCESLSCAGCTDATACNFDATATIDDGSCDFSTCAGCTDATACNFNMMATIDDGSCEFFSCAGCTDATACNFDATATIEDGSCDFSCLGCTDAGACNFDATATINDGSCDYSCLGCTDSSAVNFDPTATVDDGSCVFGMLNDIPANAFDIPLTVSNAPCVGLSGDINEATVVAPEGTFQATNPDLWYSFTTASQGVRIEVATGDFD
ncbi:MAG: hypothetical protein HRT74_10560, partial [Flavobacteriales bacterium]|nr:hypothetical protein [Flavobacteriales bacterium]